jgi:hypothetical protein
MVVAVTESRKEGGVSATIRDAVNTHYVIDVSQFAGGALTCTGNLEAAAKHGGDNFKLVASSEQGVIGGSGEVNLK